MATSINSQVTGFVGSDPQVREVGEQRVASGRKTVYQQLMVAKRRILAAIHVRFREILTGNRERDLLLKARYLTGETLSVASI